MEGKIKIILEKMISKLPYIGKWRSVFLKHSSPGHFYSPIPDLSYIKKKSDIIFDRSSKVTGIEFNIDKQYEILKSIGKNVYTNFNHFIFKPDKLYNPDNIYYQYHDVVSLFSIIMTYKPKNIIEIGCGFSSAAMIDINQHYLDNNLFLTFIEPFPENRLNNVLTKSNHKAFKLVEKYIQDVDIDEFKNLVQNDILFVDSSHVSKTGSDLNHIIFNILPELKSGVIIHFHDIHYPFEYPKEWVEKGYSWNESYILRAFLTNNKEYEIIYMNSFLNEVNSELYLSLLNTKIEYNYAEAGSIWIKKK